MIADFSFLITVLMLFAVCIALPLLIGFFVYHDAKSRNMNAALWTLIAILAPTFIGLIIYLLVRANYSAAKCPNCSTAVDEDFTVCPKCGTPFKDRCANCGFAVEPDWTVCPKCATQLATDRVPTAALVVKKDKTLGKILLAVILIPALLICSISVAGLLLRSSVPATFDDDIAIGLIKEDYAADATIGTWLSECDQQGDGVFVLRYEGMQKDYKETCLLVYNKAGSYNNCSYIAGGSNLFGGANILLSFNDQNETDGPGYELLYVYYSGSRYASLEVNTGGTRTDYTETKTSDAFGNSILTEGQLIVEIESETLEPVRGVLISFCDIDGNELFSQDFDTRIDSQTPFIYIFEKADIRTVLVRTMVFTLYDAAGAVINTGELTCDFNTADRVIIRNNSSGIDIDVE